MKDSFRRLVGARRTRSARLLAAALVAVLASCGFHLRGEASYSFESLYLNSPSAAPITPELKRALEGASSAQVVAASDKAQVVLDLNSVEDNKQILSLTGGGKVFEYLLTKRILFRVHDNEGNDWLPTSEIIVRRTYTYSDTEVLAKTYEEQRLWREMQAQGFTGTRSLVAKWIHAHGQPPPVTPAPAVSQLPAARQLAWLLVQDAEKRSAEAQALVAQLQQHTELTHVQQLVQQGAAMIRQRQAADLDAWLQTCQASPSVELQNFVDVLQRDYAAVKAALTLPWSNGPVEGHINRLKLIKRSGYGRMQLDLLRQRVLYDAA